MSPKELKWSKSAYRLYPKGVAAMVKCKSVENDKFLNRLDTAIFFSILQYISIFLVFAVSYSIYPVHSLQVMMSKYLFYYLISTFGVISLVKCLFAMSKWERVWEKHSLYQSYSPLLFLHWNCDQSLATNQKHFSIINCNKIYRIKSNIQGDQPLGILYNILNISPNFVVFYRLKF